MEKKARIFVAGHRGLVGSAIYRLLQQEGYTNLLVRTSGELDLRDQKSVAEFFETEKPEYVFLAAAKVGGIKANNEFRAEFLYDNLMIQSNVIHLAHKVGVKRLLFLGSSCIYPKNAPQPMSEDALLTSELEPTNEPYAIAKIAGLKMCENYNRQYGDQFFSVMPTNLYGPNDNFDLNTSHVIPALMRKIHLAKTQHAAQVEIWGSGNALREFMHVDDLANACMYLMNNPPSVHFVNAGSAEEISIRGLAEMLCEIIGFKGTLKFDTSKPEGVKRKVMDSSRLNATGWKSTINLKEGLTQVYHEVDKSGW
jgi:GDP-L-fucose synthase